MQKINENAFDVQALVDLVNSVKVASNHNDFIAFVYKEPSDQIKEIIKSYGGKYKIIPKQFYPSCVDDGTMLILPDCKPTIKIWSEELLYED